MHAPKVGCYAKFFHPLTMGVMHWGTVVKTHRDGAVTVRFEVTFQGKREYRTLPDHFPEGNNLDC